MSHQLVASVLAALTSAAVSLASQQQQTQDRYTQYGAKTERGATRVAYWDNARNEAAGQAAVEYGRPVWKMDYDGQLDAMTQGRIWRLGENFWTSLDTGLPLTVGGVAVPVGYYYLAVERSEDGATWELLFIDPETTRRRKLDPFEVATRPSLLAVRHRAPLTFEHRGDGSRAEKLDIELSEDRLVIAWAGFLLTAPVVVGGP